MSIWSKFRSKRFLTVFVIVTALVICAIVALSVMVPAWATYKDYYDKAIAEREHKKYLNSLPLELLGITANLGAGVEFYDNGKAAPTTDDFEVMAHFTEKGQERDEMLMPSDFELIVPADFAQKGGTVTIKYSWTSPTAEEGAEPKVLTADVPVSLTHVALKKLTVTSKPYRIYYSDEMSFKKEGMEAKAEYNDGSYVMLTERDLGVKTTGTLEAGMTAATVSYYDGESEVTADVPVTVVGASEYDDGDIVSIDTDGEVYLSEGDILADVKPSVRATYVSGNRLLLGDSNAYTVEGNTEKASFMKNCVITIRLKDDSSISKRVAATVRNGIDAEDAGKTGGKDVTVTGWAYDEDGMLIEDEAETTAVEGASELSFVLESDSIAKTNFSMRIANRTEEGGQIVPVNLASVAKLTVNGRYVPIDRNYVLAAQSAADADKYMFTDVYLPDLTLNPGANDIKLTFTSSAKLAIDRLDLTTKYEGKFYESMSDYISDCASTGSEFALDIEKVRNWSTTPGAYGHGMCSDGTYLYVTYTRWAQDLRQMIVAKFDPVTNEVVATSDWTEAATYESSAGITYYDGKIIIFYADGRTAGYVNASEFTEGCKFTDYDGFEFGGLEGQTLRDVYWNNVAQRFAVWTGNNVWIYDASKQEPIKNIALPGDNMGNPMRMTGSADYIFINYSKDGTYTPVLYLFDWEGNQVGRVVIPNTIEAMDVGSADNEKIVNTARTNTQAIAYHNGDFYFTALKFNSNNQPDVPNNGADATAYMRASLPEVSIDRDLNLNFGEFLASCADEHYEPQFEVVPATGSVGQIGDVTSGYNMGGISDGEYIYLALNTGGNVSTAIYKIDPSTYEVVANTVAVDTNIPRDESGEVVSPNYGDNSQLMIKDGVLYIFVIGNKVYSIPLSEIENGAKPVEATDLPFGKVTSGVGRTDVLKGAYWSDAVGRFAVVDKTGKMFLLEEDGTQVGDTITLRSYSGMKVTSVTGDDKYIYVAYSVNNQTSVPFDIYTWDGTFVGSGAPEGIHLRQNVGEPEDGNPVHQPYNIQAIFFHDGEMYTTFCSWTNDDYRGDTGLYLWKMSADYTTYDQTERLIGLTVEDNGARKSYKTGESFEADKITVYANYSDGKPSAEVTGYTVTPATFTEPGNYPVTVSYTVGHVTVTAETPFDVEVRAPVSVSVNTDGAKKEYRVGESFDKSSVTMTVHYTNGSSEEVTDFDVDPKTFISTGETEVTFSYSDGTNTFVAADKLTVNVSEALNFGDYVKEGGDTFTVTSVSGTRPVVPDVGTYTTGGTSDGRYVYVAMATDTVGSDSGTVTIYQLDPMNDFSVVANQRIGDFGPSGDYDRMFVKDNTLYCILEANKVYSISLGEDGTGFASNEFASATLPFTGTDAEWNEELGRYAVRNGNNIYLYNENGELVTDADVTNTFTPSGTGTLSAIASDEKYIYVSFRSDNQTSIPIVIYDWNGNLVGTCAPQSAGYPEAGYNTQAMFEYNGAMYATVCSFGTAGYHMYVWAITPVA